MIQRSVLVILGVAILTVFTTQFTRAQTQSAEESTLRFVAEFADQGASKESLPTVNVVFYGVQPSPKQAENVLRNCLKAAAAMGSKTDITARAWYAVSQEESERHTIAFVDGSNSLTYSVTDGVIAFGDTAAASARSSEKLQQSGDADNLPSITADATVVDACKNVPPERVDVLVNVGTRDDDAERKHVVKAMRTWCKENEVAIDRDTRVCMSAISKAVMASRGPTTMTPEELAAAITRGAEAYRVGECGRCHQANGRGGQGGPSLTDDQWLHGDGSMESIRKILVSGVPRNKLKEQSRPAPMDPATDLVPDKKQITDLAAYVKSLSQD